MVTSGDQVLSYWLSGIVHLKIKKTVIMRSLFKLFQTCMIFFLLLLNKNEDIWKNVGNPTVVGPH